jgi:translation initiation factor 2 beta subunit (eIF-2beta)/eIF-5
MSKNELSHQYFGIIAVVDEIRQQIQSHKDGILSTTDYQLILDALSPFSNIQTVSVFLDDCSNCAGQQLDFSNTRDFVFQKNEPFVLSFFNAPYNKEYGLDAFVYDIEKPDEYFVEKFKGSKATSINILKCTEGFDQYPICVALFPENFCAIRSFKEGFSVFYFVNVFERRFQEYGVPTLAKFVDGKSFWRLKRVSKEFRQKAFATWHYLHEYFHSTGSLPLADYLKIKSTRKAAAIEESRVDVLSILECLNSAKDNFSDGFIYAELILFERLIRYSIHSNPDENYDARSSYVLLGFLHHSGTVSLDDQIFDLDRMGLKTSLENYLSEVDQLEEEIKYALGEDVAEIRLKTAKKALVNFADTNADEGLILKQKFFNNVREKLAASCE